MQLPKKNDANQEGGGGCLVGISISRKKLMSRPMKFRSLELSKNFLHSQIRVKLLSYERAVKF